MLGLMWFCVGAASVASVWVMIEVAKRYEVSRLAWTGALGGIATVLFGFAWTVGSIVEGEPQAAALGAMMFGGMGVAIVALTGRLLIKPKQSTES